MRSCSRRLHLKMLKRSGYSDEDYTPLLYKPWFMPLLITAWLILFIIAACLD